MQSVRKYTYEGPIENIHHFLEEIISTASSQKIILNVPASTQFYKKINIDVGNKISTVVINIGGSLKITGDINSNVDLILNVSETLQVNGTIICGGKFFAKCKEFKIEGGNGKIYAYKDLSIFADNGIILSSPKTGIETEFDYSYRRVIKGESFISSGGNVTLSSKQSLIYIGGAYVIAQKNIQLGTSSDASSITVECSTIRSMEGSIFHKSRGKIFLKRTEEKLLRVIQGYPYLGAAVNYMSERARTSILVEIREEYPSSGPTIVEALCDIILEGGECVNTASTILCGGTFVTKNNYKENALSLGNISKQPRIAEHIFQADRKMYAEFGGGRYTSPFHPEYVGYNYQRHALGEISFVDYYIPNVRTCVCTVRTGTSISFNMGEFQLNGNFSSQEIFLSGASSSFAQFSKSDTYKSDGGSTCNSITPILVDDYIKTKGLTPMEEIVNGEVKSIYSANDCVSTIPVIGNSQGKDPIRHIPILHHIQSILSSMTGKAFVEKIQYPHIASPYGYASGPSLLGALIDNTKAMMEYMRHNRDGVGRGGLVELHAPILYKKEKDGILHTVLEIPPNGSHDSRGVACHTFVNTTSTQEYTNYPIRAKDNISIECDDITRKTTSYSEEKWWTEDDGNKRCHVSYSVPYPQQSFTAEEGEIHISSRKSTSIGVFNNAGKMMEKGECIQKHPLVLPHHYTSDKYGPSGFSGTKHIHASYSGMTFLKTETYAQKSTHTTAKTAFLEGVIEKTGEEIRYECDRLTIVPATCISSSLLSVKTDSHFSSHSEHCRTYSETYEKGEWSSKKIIISSLSENISGNKSENKSVGVCTDITAEELIDETENGMVFQRAIEKVHTFHSSYQKTNLHSSRYIKENYKEFAKGCVLRIQKITRNSPKGRIQFLNTFFQIEPTIVGEFLMDNYIPKSWEREESHTSQVIPDALIVVASFAIGYFTMGLGGSILANAAITCTLTSFAGSMLKYGDISMALRSIASIDHVKQIGIHAVVNSLFGTSSKPRGMPLVQRLMHRFSQNFMKATTQSILTHTLLHQKLNFSNVLFTSMVHSIAGELANAIGDANFEPLTHKAAHFACGGIMGWALTKNRKGFISGGLGVLLTEVLLDNVNLSELSEEELRNMVHQKIILSSAIIGLVGGSSVAIETSANSIENNKLNHIPGVSGAPLSPEDLDKIEEYISQTKYAYVRIQRLLQKEKNRVECYAHPFETDHLEREWEYTSSTLLKIQEGMDGMMYRLSSLPHKKWEELRGVDMLGLPSAYFLRSVQIADSLLGNPLEKIGRDIHRFGNIIRRSTFSVTKNRAFSQNMGICSEWVLGFLLTKPSGSKNTILGKKERINYHTFAESVSGKQKWSIKDITASNVINFDKKTDGMFSILNKRIVREKDAPTIIVAHGSYRSITLDSTKMIVPKPHIPFRENVPLSVSKKRITPLRKFPVEKTPMKDISYVKVELDLDHRTFARNISKKNRYPKELSLYSCHLGAGTFAQNVSNTLKIPVHAPTSGLLINYLLGTFRIVDTRMVGGAVRISPQISTGILKTFLPFRPKNVLCFAPLAILPEIREYINAYISASSEEPFVETSKHPDGVWEAACYSRDINLVSKTEDRTQQDISFAKEHIFQKEKKCPMVIIAHGSATSIRIDDIKPIENAITLEQQKQFWENGYLTVNAKEFAEILSKTETYTSHSSKHIHLFSCDTGCMPNGFAAELSKELDTTVTAFSGSAWIDPKKKVFAAASGDTDVYGRFVIFEKGTIKTFFGPSKIFY